MAGKNVSLIVAIAENHVIGKDNDLIWFLPKDLKYFKDTTAGHCVIMGRKNYFSIPDKYRPLPNRTNIVVTRQREVIKEEGVLVVGSVEQALEKAAALGDEEPFVIGGGQIYNYALANNLVDKMYITHVHNDFEGDTYFPVIDWSLWELVEEVQMKKDHRHPYDYTFAVYRKK